MSHDNIEARADISEILHRQMAAWAAGDAEAFSADVTDDVVFTNIVGMFVVGRPSFHQQHDRIFSSFYKDSQMRQAVEHITFLRPDVAIVDTLTEVEGGGPFPPNFPSHGERVRTRLEQVMVHDGHRWRVAAFHNVPIPPDFTGAAPT